MPIVPGAHGLLREYTAQRDSREGGVLEVGGGRLVAEVATEDAAECVADVAAERAAVLLLSGLLKFTQQWTTVWVEVR